MHKIFVLKKLGFKKSFFSSNVNQIDKIVNKKLN